MNNIREYFNDELRRNWLQHEACEGQAVEEFRLIKLLLRSEMWRLLRKAMCATTVRLRRPFGQIDAADGGVRAAGVEDVRVSAGVILGLAPDIERQYGNTSFSLGYCGQNEECQRKKWNSIWKKMKKMACFVNKNTVSRRVFGTGWHLRKIVN